MDFFVNDNSHQFYKNCSGFSHSKGTVMQCTFLESKNIGIFRDINFLMPDYELPQIKRVKLLKFFVVKTLVSILQVLWKIGVLSRSALAFTFNFHFNYHFPLSRCGTEISLQKKNFHFCLKRKWK